MVPAILLVRGNSKRLPRKWALPWGDGTLASNAVAAVNACPVVSRLYVASDDRHVLDTAGDFQSIHRPHVDDAQTSLQGLRWVLGRAGLEASYVLLVQCTAPFINPTDLERLVLLALERPGREVWGLTTDTRNPKPSGMAWLVPPFCNDLRPTRWVLQDAPDYDVDTREDYDRALAHERG